MLNIVFEPIFARFLCSCKNIIFYYNIFIIKIFYLIFISINFYI